MKTKTILITLIGLLAVTSLVFQACKKENDSDNQAPELPSNPVPSDQLTGISISTLLEWECTDPEDDPLTFDIYFGTNNPPSIVESSQSSFSFDPGTLYKSTQYYWKIVAKDDHGNQTEGAIWTFTTTGGGDSTFTDPRDGQVYNIVTIGTQIWFAENLNYETSDSWWYDNRSSNGNIYGRLYTFDAALTACPSGWHLPSNDEWKILEGNADTQYGVGHSVWDGMGFRGYDAGKRLKTTTGWSSNTGTDAFGFSALPGGQHLSGGGFINLGDAGRWWLATEINFMIAWNRMLFYHSDKVGSSPFFQGEGYSVRCIKN